MRIPTLILATSLAFLVFRGLVGFAASDEPAKPPHLADAEEIATHIAADDNDYAYKDVYLHWPGVDGASKYACHADCSGFFDLLLEHSYGVKHGQLKQWTGHIRPTAAEWFDAITGGKTKGTFAPLATLDQALPGDVFIIKYQPGEQKDTGHVMILDSAPALRKSSAPEIAGTTQWEVRVIDSSKSGHGPHDTRHQPDGTFGRGVGIGVLRVYTQADNTIAGYSWSTTKASKHESVEQHQVILARLMLAAPNAPATQR